MALFRQFLKRRNKTMDQTLNMDSNGSNVWHGGNTSSRINYDDVCTAPLPYPRENFRLVIFKQTEKGSQKLLYDSRTVKRRTAAATATTPTSPRSAAAVRVEGKFQFYPMRDDVQELGEMIFGSMPMRYKGDSLKMHEFSSPKQMMLAKVFASRRASAKQRNIKPPAIDENSTIVTVSSNGQTSATMGGGDCGGGSSDSDSQYSTVRSLDGYTPGAPISRSIPVQVPERLFMTTTTAGGGGGAGSLVIPGTSCLTSPRSNISRSSSAIALCSRSNSPICGSAGLPTGLARFARLRISQATSLEGNSGVASTRRRLSTTGSGCSDDPTTTSPVSSSSASNSLTRSSTGGGSNVRFGVGVIFSLNNQELETHPFTSHPTATCYDAYRHFLLTHVQQIESDMTCLQERVHDAFARNQRSCDFYEKVHQSWVHFIDNVSNLYESPRLSCPIWLDLVASPPQPPPQPSPNGTSCCNRPDLARLFLDTLTHVVGTVDNKQSNFFVTRLISTILTFHLSWVTSVAPRDTHELLVPAGSRTPPPTRKQSSAYLITKHNSSTTTTASESDTQSLAQTMMMTRSLSPLSLTSSLVGDFANASEVTATAFQQPYNVHTAQYMDVSGCVGYPVRQARTVLVGENTRLLQQLLIVLSYWIRCSELCEQQHETVDELFAKLTEVTEEQHEPDQVCDVTEHTTTTTLLCETSAAPPPCATPSPTHDTVDCVAVADRHIVDAPTPACTIEPSMSPSKVKRRSSGSRRFSGEKLTRLRSGSCNSCSISSTGVMTSVGRRRGSDTILRHTTRTSETQTLHVDVQDSDAENVTPARVSGRFSIRPVFSMASDGDLLIDKSNISSSGPVGQHELQFCAGQQRASSVTDNRLDKSGGSDNNNTVKTRPALVEQLMMSAALKRKQSTDSGYTTLTNRTQTGTDASTTPLATVAVADVVRPSSLGHEEEQKCNAANDAKAEVPSATPTSHKDQLTHNSTHQTVISSVDSGMGCDDTDGVVLPSLGVRLHREQPSMGGRCHGDDNDHNRKQQQQQTNTSMLLSSGSEPDASLLEDECCGDHVRAHTNTTTTTAGVVTNNAAVHAAWPVGGMDQAHVRLFAGVPQHQLSVDGSERDGLISPMASPSSITTTATDKCSAVQHLATCSRNNSSTSCSCTTASHALRNLGHSLLGGVTTRYNRHFAISALQRAPTITDSISTPGRTPTINRHNSIELTLCDEVYHQQRRSAVSVTERQTCSDADVCILANVDDWSVKVLKGSQASEAVDYPRFADYNVPSLTVLNMVDNVTNLYSMNSTPEFCLSYMEDTLSDLYSKSCSLAKVISERSVGATLLTNEFSDVVDSDISDIPLLMAIAGVHSPGVLSAVTFQ